MIRRLSLKRTLPGLIILAVLVFLGIAGYRFMGPESFIRTALSGLTLSALYFMVAAGLTIIFGLMDVLNFAHGAMFMTGAYMGWQFYTNPTFLFGLLPLVLAFVAGISTTGLWIPVVSKWKVTDKGRKSLGILLVLVALALVVVGFLKFDVMGLAKTAMVTAMNAGNPIAEASPQEALAIFWRRPLLMLLSGLLLAISAARPGDDTQVVPENKTIPWVRFGVLIAVMIAAVFFRESASIAVLKMNGTLRFFLALLVGAGVGAGLGSLVEVSLIRPLYSRPFYIVLLTLGLGYVSTGSYPVAVGPHSVFDGCTAIVLAARQSGEHAGVV